MDIIGRAEWGARYGAGYATAGAKLEFYLHHSAAAFLTPGSSRQAEEAEWRRIEDYHAKHLTPTNPRIGYPFGIAPSGRAYEGTGWGRVGAHTAGRNSSAYAVVLLMDGTATLPTVEAVQAANELRLIGVREGHLHPAHAFRGHREEVATACPGDRVFRAVIGTIRASHAPPVQGIDAIAPLPSLRLGSGGQAAPAHLREAVRQLQRMLGMEDRHRTGFFWTITYDAVVAFQRERGLLVDGIVGPKTWAALLS